MPSALNTRVVASRAIAYLGNLQESAGYEVSLAPLKSSVWRLKVGDESQARQSTEPHWSGRGPRNPLKSRLGRASKSVPRDPDLSRTIITFILYRLCSSMMELQFPILDSGMN